MATTPIPIYSLDLTQLASIEPEQINSLLEKYPYAHNLHTIKILSAKAKKDPEFIKILNSEILYIPDRSHLKKLVENLDQISLPESMPHPDKVEDEDVQLAGQTEDEVAEIINSEIEYESIFEQETMSNAIDETEPKVLSEDEEDPISEHVAEDETTEDDIVDPEGFKPGQTTESMEDKDIIIKADTDLPLHTEDDHELSDFSKWLKAKNTLSGDVETPKSKEEDSANEWEGLQDKILASYQSGTLGKEEKHKKDPADKKKKKLKPKIDETEVITESYALLLEQQGKFNKAIKIYEKLSLIIPEKTTYFADKIEHLKNK